MATLSRMRRREVVCEIIRRCYHAARLAQARISAIESPLPVETDVMDEKEFADRCQQELALIEAAVESAADAGAEVDFEMQSGILEIECADGSKVIVSPHMIAQEIWVAARSGGFHFRHDVAEGWVDTRSGDSLHQRLIEILKQQGQVALNLA